MFVYECIDRLICAWDRATHWDKCTYKTNVQINTLIVSRSTIVYDLCNYYTIQCITPKRIWGIIWEMNTCQHTILLPLSNCLRVVKTFISGRIMTEAMINDDDDDDDQDRLEQCGEHFK